MFAIVGGVTWAILALAQQRESHELFTIVDASTMSWSPEQEARVDELRKQSATVSVQLVKVNTAELKTSTGRLQFDVATDLHLEAKQMETLPSGENIRSVTFQDPLDSATFVDLDGNITGTIHAQHRLFSIQPLGNGLHALVEHDESKLPPEHPESFKTIEERAVAAPTNRQDARPQSLKHNKPSIPILRVLVAYTPEAHRSNPDIRGLIKQAISQTNDSYAKSRISLRAELADSFEVDYQESDFDRMLSDFAGRTDGAMDEVHLHRDQSKADVCVLLVNNDTSCGLAEAILATEDTAFAVVNARCARLQYSLTHEIGHLQGARHNPDEDANTSPFAYGHGYCDSQDGWRTIMSYPCCDNCRRVPYWSNPNAHVGKDHPMGTISQCDNARVLNKTAPIVTAFRN